MGRRFHCIYFIWIRKLFSDSGFLQRWAGVCLKLKFPEKRSIWYDSVCYWYLDIKKKQVTLRNFTKKSPIKTESIPFQSQWNPSIPTTGDLPQNQKREPAKTISAATSPDSISPFRRTPDISHRDTTAMAKVALAVNVGSWRIAGIHQSQLGLR